MKEETLFFLSTIIKKNKRLNKEKNKRKKNVRI
jgi:hypothetical protein